MATGDAAFPCSVAGGGSGAFAGRRLDAGRLPLGPQQGDGRLEVLQGLEALVDARESEVGDLVELAQGREDRQSDLVGLDLGGAGGADLLLDPLGEQGQLVLPDGPALAGLADTGHDLAPAERFGDPRALHDREARGLDRAEAAAALWTDPAAPDRDPVIGAA